MKIAFNSTISGLGNNGGSKTILKCCEALNSIGHRCDVIANLDKFTWFQHKKVINYVPKDLDIIIATACHDVQHTLNTNIPRKAWYIRGHETWSMPAKRLGNLYNSNILNLVNSKGLQQLLSTYGADSNVIYQGVDFNLWKNRKLRSKNKIRIGCLYQKKKTKRWQDFISLANALGTKNYEYVGIGMSKRKDPFLKNFWYNASIEQLNNVYSSCHIWFAPTELEGLHNVPIEAAMCGCLIVCSDHPMNGMGFDYAFDNNTAMIYHARDIEQAASLIKNPNWDCKKRMLNCLYHTIGSRKDNMKKMISYLEDL